MSTEKKFVNHGVDSSNKLNLLQLPRLNLKIIYYAGCSFVGRLKIVRRECCQTFTHVKKGEEPVSNFDLLQHSLINSGLKSFV